MSKLSDTVRRVLYTVLPMNWYFGILSKMYLIAFKLGLLKNSREYAYPYFLHNIIKKGDVCIDIGANMGYMSTLFSKLVGSQGKVYSVEPVKPMLAALRRNTKRMTNVEILPYALGLENKAIQLGNNTIQKNGFMSSGRHEVIESDEEVDIHFDATMRKGSELFADIDRVDFIKCDIEGYETIVIPEIKSIIEKHSPILLIESRNDDRRELLAFFKSINYNSYILKDKKLVPASVTDFMDMLTIPKEKVSHYSELIK